MPKYPKVNYIGNKEKIVDWIIGEFPVKEGTVLDIFAGGCSVSYALKNAGYSVISNDILYADFVIAKALIENGNTTLSPEILTQKVEPDLCNNIFNNISFLANKIYYPEEVKELARLIALSNTLESYEKYLFLSLVRRAMIRKLPYSRMNVPWEQIKLLRNEEYSYEKYKRKRAYHNQTFTDHILENINAYNNAIFSAEECVAYNLDAMEIIKAIDKVDVVYMDPPYPSTMNNYDAFYGLFDKMFNKQSCHIDFTNKTTFLDNISTLISTLSEKTNYIVLSQNTRVKPAPDEIEKMLSKFGSVTIKEKKHNYQVTGKDNKNSSRELLFILDLNKCK